MQPQQKQQQQETRFPFLFVQPVSTTTASSSHMQINSTINTQDAISPPPPPPPLLLHNQQQAVKKNTVNFTEIPLPRVGMQIESDDSIDEVTRKLKNYIERLSEILIGMHTTISHVKKEAKFNNSCALNTSVQMKQIGVYFIELGRLELEMTNDSTVNRQYIEIIHSLIDAKYENLSENITKYGRILEKHNLLTAYTLVQMWLNGSIEINPILNTHSFIKHIKLIPPSQSPFDAFMRASLEKCNNRKKINYELCKIISDNLEINKTHTVNDLKHDFLPLGELTFKNSSFNTFKENFNIFHKKSLFFLELINKKLHNVSDVYANIQVL